MPLELLAPSDSVQYTKVTKRKTALMLRAGGLGDLVILTAVGKALNARGYDVDFFLGSPTGKVFKLVEGLPYFRSVKELSRINDIDCIQLEDKSYVSVEILKAQYDEVFDFKFSVENNAAGLNPRVGWRDTINSNYQNWVDLSLGWANIDPTKVADEDKRPEINKNFPEEYQKWIESTPLWNSNSRIIGIQLIASSLVRSWYRSHELPDIIHKQYPDDIVVIFVGGKWVMISEHGKSELTFPEELDPLICSAMILQQMSVFISADSGMSHVAEALNVPTIGVYTTVPAWTRVKYYKYAHPIEANVECHPCFTLDAFCPIIKKQTEDELSEREKDILKSAKERVDIFQIAKKYETVPQAIVAEAEATVKKAQALAARMPACVSDITQERILDALTLFLGKERS